MNQKATTFLALLLAAGTLLLAAGAFVALIWLETESPLPAHTPERSAPEAPVEDPDDESGELHVIRIDAHELLQELRVETPEEEPAMAPVEEPLTDAERKKLEAMEGLRSRMIVGDPLLAFTPHRAAHSKLLNPHGKEVSEDGMRTLAVIAERYQPLGRQIAEWQGERNDRLGYGPEVYVGDLQDLYSTYSKMMLEEVFAFFNAHNAEFEDNPIPKLREYWISRDHR